MADSKTPVAPAAKRPRVSSAAENVPDSSFVQALMEMDAEDGASGAPVRGGIYLFSSLPFLLLLPWCHARPLC